jgi:hypothetical protein
LETAGYIGWNAGKINPKLAANAGALPLPHSPSKTGVNSLNGERVGVKGKRAIEKF